MNKWVTFVIKIFYSRSVNDSYSLTHPIAWLKIQIFNNTILCDRYLKGSPYEFSLNKLASFHNAISCNSEADASYFKNIFLTISLKILVLSPSLSWIKKKRFISSYLALLFQRFWTVAIFVCILYRLPLFFILLKFHFSDLFPSFLHLFVLFDFSKFGEHTVRRFGGSRVLFLEFLPQSFLLLLWQLFSFFLFLNWSLKKRKINLICKYIISQEFRWDI